MSKKSLIPEDWVIVILGFLIIISALAGLVLAAPEYSWETSDQLFANVLTLSNLGNIALQLLFVVIVAATGGWLTGKPLNRQLIVFPVIYLITIVALIIAGNAGIKSLNLEAVIFSLFIGLLIGNVFDLPEWFKQALNSEFYVKIGLILLGTTIIFADILKAGSLGLIQALAVVLSVWYFSFWVCKKLKIDSELTMMLSSAVSICGVSAAIATSGAIKGDSKKLSLVISLVLITAVPMMIFMPYAAKLLGLSQEVTGAWLGGSIDTTGAVVASGTLVGETALKISSIVKFSQNVLLGLAAFAISVYWTYTKHPSAQTENKPTLSIIWDRFPKFVIGFIAASVLFSFLLNAGQIIAVKGHLKNLQSLWFALAFTSIGLETNFGDLINKESRKPVYAFLIAQTFNVLITLAIASLLFK